MAALTIFYLLLASFGHDPPELVNLIDPDAYFNARNIPVNTEKMEKLAGTRPQIAADQVAQLLAIRWLGEHDALQARTTLLKIANGELGQDELGFAKEHARRALGRIEKQVPPPPGGAGRNLKECLAWFPRDVTFCAAIDLRVSWADNPFAPTVLSNVPGPFPWGLLYDQGQLFPFADQAGNFRLERVAVAFAAPKAGTQAQKIFVRFTGVADHKRLADFLRGKMGQCTVRDEKGHAEPVTSIVGAGGQAWVMVGNTDLIFIGSEEADAGLPELVQDILAVKAARKPNALASPLAGDLDRIPENAHAFAVGSVPLEMFDTNAQNDPLLALLNKGIVMHAVVRKQIDVRFRARTKNVADAQAAVAAVTRFQKEQTDNLKQLLPDASAQVLIDDLASMQVTAAGAEVTGQAVLSRDSVRAMGNVLDRTITAGVAAALTAGFAALAAALRIAVTVVALVLLAALGGIVALLVLSRRAAKSSN